MFSQAALAHGVMAGRKGYGSIFVVASGNGGHFKDNCNFDGYANSIFTVTVGMWNFPLILWLDNFSKLEQRISLCSNDQ